MNELLDFYKNKNVFITGHTGFKGTWLSRILINAGANVTGFSLDAPTNPSLFEETQTSKEINHIIGDIRDYQAVYNALNNTKPEVVFHLAAQPLVRLSYKEPVETYATNVMGTVNILEAIRNCNGIKSFVNVTTDKVYENKEWYWGYRENENLCGFDPYSNSKSCSELVTHSYRNSFFSNNKSCSISTARSGNVIGGGDYATDRIIPDCIRSTEKGETIGIRNPASTRPYQHVLECLRGYLLLAKLQYNNKTLEGSYNFGPDDESCVTTGELTDLFCKTWGADASWQNQAEENAPHEASFLKLDCSKSKNVLGWYPKWTIKIAIEKIVDWQKYFSSGKTAKEITDQQIKEYFAQ